MDKKEFEDLEEYFVAIIDYKIEEGFGRDSLHETVRSAKLRENFVNKWVGK